MTRGWESQVEIRDVVYGVRAGESKGETHGEPILLALLQLLKFCGTPRLAPVQRDNETHVSLVLCADVRLRMDFRKRFFTTGWSISQLEGHPGGEKFDFYSVPSGLLNFLAVVSTSLSLLNCMYCWISSCSAAEIMALYVEGKSWWCGDDDDHFSSRIFRLCFIPSTQDIIIPQWQQLNKLDLIFCPSPPSF